MHGAYVNPPVGLALVARCQALAREFHDPSNVGPAVALERAVAALVVGIALEVDFLAGVARTALTSVDVRLGFALTMRAQMPATAAVAADVNPNCVV